MEKNATNVQVLVRARPRLSHETDAPCGLIGCDEGAVRVQYNTGTDKVFAFDKVLDGSAVQDDVFEYSSPLIDHALDGLHATIFAYGQTGAGKTFTMEGFDYSGGNTDTANRLRPVMSTAKHKHGIIPRAIEAVFDRSCQRMQHNPRVKYKIKVSYYQIYNEKVADLLNVPWKKEKVDKSGLRIRWSKNNTFYVENLFVFEVESASQARELFSTGVKNKAMGSHQMNLQSSRSHAVFTVYVESWDPQAPECVIKSELTLVDLAGSEKLTLMSKNPSAKLLQESIEINASLLALGKVISALGEKGGKQHVPYRDSKLTKLLKHALGGNSLTLMIACINPCDAYVEETVSTLFYAGRARNIRNDPRVNEDSKTSLIKALRAEIASLKMELSHFRKIAMEGESSVPAASTVPTRPGQDPVSFEGRPHTAGDLDQSREVVFLGEKLVDSVKMLKDIIMVNGQLREAVDEMGSSRAETEANLQQLNDENIQLRERIEMLESIVMQDDSEPAQRPKQQKTAPAAGQAQPAAQQQPQQPHHAPRAAPVATTKSGRKALERYRSRYKQPKLPSYTDYYSVAATRTRSGSKPEAKASAPSQRAFEGLKVKQNQPLFTRRSVDASGQGLQSAASMALEFSRMQQSARSGPASSFRAAAQPAASSSTAAQSFPTAAPSVSSLDAELEQRRKARSQRAAQLEAQHRALQQRLVAGGGPLASSFTPSLVPQVPPPPAQLSARRASEGSEGYLSREEASMYFSPEQLSIINRRKQMDKT